MGILTGGSVCGGSAIISFPLPSNAAMALDPFTLEELKTAITELLQRLDTDRTFNSPQGAVTLAVLAKAITVCLVTIDEAINARTSPTTSKQPFQKKPSNGIGAL